METSSNWLARKATDEDYGDADLSRILNITHTQGALMHCKPLLLFAVSIIVTLPCVVSADDTNALSKAEK